MRRSRGVCFIAVHTDLVCFMKVELFFVNSSSI